jgi:hypothetical protein
VTPLLFSSGRRAALAACAPIAATVLLAVSPAAPAAPAPKPALHCTITGTAGDDVLHGTSGDDVICGEAGNDVIYGGAGNDHIYGGAGNDVIYGGAGNDALVGGPGTDRLAGGPGADSLFGSGDDILAGGSGNDTTIHGRILKDNRRFGVSIKASYDVPVGTVVTWKYNGGNCTADEANFTGTISDPSAVDQFHLFTGVSGDFWESCAYERSNAWFRVTFVAPTGLTRSVDINVHQTSSPTIVEHTIGVECADGDMPCSGTSATAPGSRLVVPSVRFGPLKEDPKPPKAPSLACHGSVTVSPGDVMRNVHLCTSAGNPLPSLTYESSHLPNGVVASRWPAPDGDWIVLNGRVNDRPGIYWLAVQARLPGWERRDESTFEIEGWGARPGGGRR